jgi:hypothetical protein
MLAHILNQSLHNTFCNGTYKPIAIMENLEYYDEEKVLTPLPHELLNKEGEENWPEFFLNQTEVTTRDGQITSLFTASLENQLEITGILQKKRK